eukprot:GSChrysophyteH1.ASY1.ANO1.1052.1 assembled CDS
MRSCGADGHCVVFFVRKVLFQDNRCQCKYHLPHVMGQSRGTVTPVLLRKHIFHEGMHTLFVGRILKCAVE